MFTLFPGKENTPQRYPHDVTPLAPIQTKKYAGEQNPFEKGKRHDIDMSMGVPKN